MHACVSFCVCGVLCTYRLWDKTSLTERALANYHREDVETQRIGDTGPQRATTPPTRASRHLHEEVQKWEERLVAK
jgi:hypothetical protein